MGGLSVQRVTLREKLTQLLVRVSHLQQGPLRIMAQPAKQVVCAGIEVHHMAPGAKMLAVGFTQDRPATSRQNARLALCQFIDYLFFQIPKRFFTLTRKKLTNTATDTLLDCMVRVSKWNLKPPGKLPPDGGFSRAGEAD
jgi:hypothetical protein